MSTHTISVLVENKSGVLARVSALFARRGFNIDSLAVGETEDPTVSRMTIAVHADGAPLEQVEKQLHKLINVLRIAEMPQSTAIERELALIKVEAGPSTKAEIIEIADIFRGRIVDVTRMSAVVEVVGAPDKIAAIEELLHPYGIIEMVRTGRIALNRGEAGLKAPRPKPISLISA